MLLAEVDHLLKVAGLEDLDVAEKGLHKDIVPVQDGFEFFLVDVANTRPAHCPQAELVAVVGKKEPVTVYEPMYPEEYEEMREVLDVFSKGLDLFYEGLFEEAITVFSGIESKDPAAAAYRKKSQELNASPPENWEGVWVMSTK